MWDIINDLPLLHRSKSLFLLQPRDEDYYAYNSAAAASSAFASPAGRQLPTSCTAQAAKSIAPVARPLQEARDCQVHWGWRHLHCLCTWALLAVHVHCTQRLAILAAVDAPSCVQVNSVCGMWAAEPSADDQ